MHIVQQWFISASITLCHKRWYFFAEPLKFKPVCCSQVLLKPPSQTLYALEMLSVPAWQAQWTSTKECTLVFWWFHKSLFVFVIICTYLLMWSFDSLELIVKKTIDAFVLFCIVSYLNLMKAKIYIPRQTGTRPVTVVLDDVICQLILEAGIMIIIKY